MKTIYIIIFFLSLVNNAHCQSSDDGFLKHFHREIFKLGNAYFKKGADTVFGFSYQRTYPSFSFWDKNSKVISSGIFLIIKQKNKTLTYRSIKFENKDSLIQIKTVYKDSSIKEIFNLLYDRIFLDFAPAVYKFTDSANNSHYNAVLSDGMHSPTQAFYYKTQQTTIFNLILESSLKKMNFDFENLNYKYNINSSNFYFYKILYKLCLGSEFIEDK